MARRKRDPDPSPLETRLEAICARAVSDNFTNAMVIWTTPDGTTLWRSAPQSHVAERGMVETVLEEMKPKRVLTEE